MENASLNIVLLARSLGFGGAERQLVVLAKALAARGHIVSVALFYSGGPLNTELTSAGISVYSLNKRGRWDLAGPLLRLIRILKRNRPAVLYSFLPAANIVAAAVCKIIRGPRLIFGVRASDMDLSRYDSVSRWSYAIEARLARQADLIIANSEAGRRQAIARGMPADLIAVIPNGIDTHRFQPSPNPERQAGGYHIGMMARVDPMKDHDTFLAAIKIIARHRSDVTFVLAGPGTESLERRAAGLPVELRGATPNPEQLISQFDVAVLSSCYGEGFPNVIGEAMACGVPCVVTDVGDSAQVVGSLGRVVPPRNPDALAAAIIDLLGVARDADVRAACREHIEKNFSVANLADRTEAALLNIARPVVLHVITGLGLGGAEGMLARLACLPGRFSPIVVSLTGCGVWGQTLRAAGVKVVDLGMRRGAFSLAGLWRLISLMRHSKPAIVQTWLYHADLLGLIAARVSGVMPVIWNLRCSNMDLSRYGWLTRLTVKILARLSSSPDAVVVNSVAGRQWHSQIGYRPRAWEYIPNGIDVERFKPDISARQLWRRRLGVGPNTILIGMAARRDPMKDHEGVLEAAAMIDGDIAYAFVGKDVVPSDYVLSHLAEKIKQPVHFLDSCNDMPGFMAALDIALLASHFGEGFPNVIAEAMACGVPSIATDVGDASSIIDDTGIVVAPGDTQALARAIQTLAFDPAMRLKLGEMARKRIVEKYELHAIGHRYDALWSKLSDAKK